MWQREGSLPKGRTFKSTLATKTKTKAKAKSYVIEADYTSCEGWLQNTPTISTGTVQ